MNIQKSISQTKNWWEKPGFSIQYQIEARPGWLWNRNCDKFNTSMMDENGNLNFNGPFCKMKKWVEFSEKVGVDYHMFESKWHDGICYWNTKYTNWKTPTDYCRIFSEESKKAGIPFLYYYSSIFDHNPQFDDIQPLREITPSFIALHNENKETIPEYSMNYLKTIWEMNKIEIKERKIPYKGEFFYDVKFHDFRYNPENYEDYLLKQIRELIDKYEPDGMWMDWYWNDASTPLVINFMEKNYPNILLIFNVSIDRHPKYVHYLSGEAHDVKSAWESGQRYRNKKKPWELVGPAAYAWDVPEARPDPYEIFRIAAIIMASGGKYCFGLPSQMNGELYPEPAKNVELFGEWYKLRRELFTEAIPMKYKGENIPGIELNEENFRSIGTLHGNDNLIHIINLKGLKKELVIEFTGSQWSNISKVLLEPAKKELQFSTKKDTTILKINKDDIDPADTLLRIVTNK
ncbi:MAG: alpha-L-fucosidase [Promethearchaeota archaeon]